MSMGEGGPESKEHGSSVQDAKLRKAGPEGCLEGTRIER